MTGGHVIPDSRVIVAGQRIYPPEYPGAGAGAHGIIDIHIERTTVQPQISIYTGVLVDGLLVLIVYHKLPRAGAQPLALGGVGWHLCLQRSAAGIQCVEGQWFGAVIDQYDGALFMAGLSKGSRGTMTGGEQ